MKFNFSKLFFLFSLAGYIGSGTTFARTIYPADKNSVPAQRGGYDTHKVNMIVLYAGAAAGGHQNTCYFLKSKITIADKFNLDGSAFYLLNGDHLYSANVSFGNFIAFSAGMEWGDRTYFLNKDSTIEHLKFKDQATGQYATYASLNGITFPEQVQTYEMGISFGGRIPSINYWRGHGRCWSILSFKFEMLYAPEVTYSSTYNYIVDSTSHTTRIYDLEGASVRHFGYRLVVDTRLSSKIGFMMETGTRPGLKYEISPEKKFSNGYLRMGVEIGISVGGRKALKEAEMN